MRIDVSTQVWRLWRGVSSFLASSRGDVLMEYVVMTLLIVGPLIMASEGLLFNIQGLAEGDVDNFGYVGQRFVLRWRMIMCGVGLPLP